MSKKFIDIKEIKEYNPVRAYLQLPSGDFVDIPALFDENAPEKYTVLGFLKKWQAINISSKTKRKICNIEITRKKCPKCGNKIFRTVRGKRVFEWCKNFPNCNYQRSDKLL